MGIYVWGTGCGASELISNGLSIENITAFIDNFPNADTFMNRPVLLPEKLSISDCELLIVTARDSSAIEKKCKELGICETSIFYLKNSWQFTDKNEYCSSARTLLGDNLYEKLLQKQRVVTVPHSLKNSLLPDADQSNDYVRLATLELLCRRLNKLPGCIAELGVYKGNFARYLNFLMPERKLYLFDSFEGFDTQEGEKEKSENRCSDAFLAAHKNTSISQVLQKLPYPEKAVICQGYFPDSAKNISEQFCLVSLDVDFEDTTFEGLCYFWPKMVTGGYVLLHDWNSPNLTGVQNALHRFEAILGHPIPSVPLCDTGGTLILCK